MIRLRIKLVRVEWLVPVDESTAAVTASQIESAVTITSFVVSPATIPYLDRTAL